MSRQGTHPLDERFRRVLHDAEVPPPPAVWEALAHAQQARRGRRGLWGRFLALMLLPLLGSMVMLRGTKAQEELYADAGAEPSAVVTAIHTGAATAATTAAFNTTDPITEQASVAAHTAMGTQATPAPVPHAAMRTEASPPSATGSTNTPGRSVSGPENPASGQAGSSIAAALADHTAQSMGDDPTATAIVGEQAAMPWHGPGFMRPIVQGIAPPPLEERLLHAPPQLPAMARGEWLIGMEMGSYHTRHRWQGADAKLSSAIDAMEPWRTTLAPALRIGRRWYNGWSLFTGLALERSEAAFSHTDRSITRTEEVQTWYVTLNNTVFISDIDTVVNISVEERLSRGTNVRSALRIPLEGRWQRDLGRLHLGVRAGLCLELTRTRGGHTLVRDSEQGGIRAESDGAALLARRHPPALLGMVGLEAGYLLHERWSLHAGPMMMTGIAGFGGDGEANALPMRRGFTFGILHHFNTKQP